MSKKIVVTNLRIPEDDWLEVKVIASSFGISVNQYIKELIRMETVRTMLGKEGTGMPPKGYSALRKFVERKIKGRPMGLSEEDKTIYR